VLAVLFLGEQVRWRRWSATVVGFLGVLLMIRPGHGEFEPAALVAIGGVMVVAFVVILVKKLSHTERPLTMLVYFAMTATAVLAWPAAAVWQAPSLAEWPFLVLMGVLATSGQACVILSYRVGEATAVTPIGYTQLLFATAAGIAFFAEWPDVWTLGGAGIIVASTVYIAQREHRIGQGLKPEQKARSLFVRQT
jgi:drug/metabolite transporter (DMT)-like permease